MFASSSKLVLNAARHLTARAYARTATASVASKTPSNWPARTGQSSATRGRDGAPPNREDSLRGTPWSFNQENGPMQINRRDPVVRYNMRLQECADNKRAQGALAICAEMKAKDVHPDRTTYGCLLAALAPQQMMHRECWAVFYDMLAMGIEPDTYIFNHLLQSVITTHSDEVYKVLETMAQHGVQPDATTHDLLIQSSLSLDCLELGLCRLAEMEDAGFSPSLKTTQELVLKAAEGGFTRLALDLAAAFETGSVRRFESGTWVKLLSACAQNLYGDGVLTCWKKVVDDLAIVPDEGLCMAVLHTAARHGLPVLATQVLQQLEKQKLALREQHLLPVLESFVTAGSIKDAFRALDLFRSSKVPVTLETGRSILKAIQRDPDDIDKAFTYLEEIVNEGQVVDVVAVNVIIQAATFLNDLQRVIGMYKSMSKLNVQPDVTTYNLLLSACTAAQHRELGDRLFQEMKDTLLKPNTETYRQLIALYLTQADYEDAFFYLEEMKAQSLKPPYWCYDAIVRKCVSMGDSRYRLAVEELEQMNYRMTSGLRTFVETGGNVKT